ncbi:Histone acetyltransferase protein [Dioscorea alata]|uniref:Histone acetyltransferase protein n=1 Tax=Dioscorea alata TaxID=55571 RepID=A0ACB7UJK2_DIOAL|nr:Histone acetyltransferase protein [Dioscorea alata]
MDSFFRSTTLVASSSYPDSIAWSEENLVAIASGHIITILSPASIVSPRGLITLPPNKLFPVGAVKKEDLNAACLMPNLLSRENRPCSRSISWSPLGLAPNSGCLLAVCTTEGRVKIYRAPFCEFNSEWVEVVDVSDMLLYYLDSIKFRELLVPEQVEGGLAIECQESSISKVPKRIKRSYDANESSQTLLQSKKCNLLSQVTAKQYSSRRALLSSTIVAWSPVLHSSANYHSSNSFCGSCSILATGGKSGNISFWRICEPPCYTIEHGRLSADPVLIGLLQAHNSWVTAISWAISSASSLEPQLILSTGSYDGSVKLWTADISVLIKSAEPNKACFSLLKEMASSSSVSISTISLVVPAQSPDMVILAAGKGSGSIEVCICHISNNDFQSIGIYDAHDQMVTGLAWSFNGCCLYSCSQDNSVRCWALHQNSLLEVFFPSASRKSPTKYLQVSDPCFGIALSPGGLMIALVHSFDANLLNPMYQARTQKAAAEFLWIGGQSLMIPSEKHLDCNPETISGSSENDLMCWESNILWSLECFENVDKPLSFWDVIAALVHFRKTMPLFLENLLIKWISKWFGLESVDSIEKILSHAGSMLSKISSRKLHLLNIICRRLMLIQAKASVPNGIQVKSSGLDDDEKILWDNLLINVEAELRQRLVAFSFRAVLSHAPCSSSVTSDVTNWLPNGIMQMEQWLSINSDFVHPRLKLLGAKIREIKNSDCVNEESCSFCSASVPFESPETATCAGNKLNKNHRLHRCAVSMQLCSITEPMWFCVCCRRSAGRLIPQSFFTMMETLQDEPLTVHGSLKPLCPFCGVLLQRLLPDFLLSTSPV